MKNLNTVTTTSKVLAAVLFVILPFVGFYVGVMYCQQNSLDESYMAMNKCQPIMDAGYMMNK